MSEAVTFGPPLVSIDVEDWPQSSWDRALPITDRAADNTRHLLDVLDQLGIRATMFVLGKFAERFPQLVAQISQRGHEVASHGFGHVEIFHQSPTEFSEDVRRSKVLLEEITGQPVRGYRAPDFSIVRRSLWALDVLVDEGFEYDSSIFPVRRPRYGIPDWPDHPVRVALANGRQILEFPIGTYRAWGKNWPVGGGGYHRLLPGFAGRWLAGSVMRSRPFVFYCHPYEFDPREFAEITLPIPLKIRLHQGLGRGRFEGRFRAFVKRYGGTPIADLLDRDWPTFDLAALPAPDTRG